MKNKHGVFLVLMIFTLIAAVSGCTKKNVPPPPGYGGAEQYGQGGAAGLVAWTMPSGGNWASTRKPKKESFWIELKPLRTRMSTSIMTLIRLQIRQKRFWTKKWPF